MAAGGYSYEQAGVNIDVADATKRAMARSIDRGDPRVLNRVGAFAALVDGRFAAYREPILVLKTEEPGSKQKLAFQHGRVTSICQDLINHLIDDILVMGAEPLYVQDCIICGKIEPDVVKGLVAGMAEACRAQGCVLVGGETSEQPGVVDAGLYILSASIVGVVERSRIIDGQRIREGDVVLAAASSGMHTNGYSLVRALMAAQPDLPGRDVAGESFLDAIMRPHRCYRDALAGVVADERLHGLAHITGGGIAGNLNRILPGELDARIELDRIRILPVFQAIREAGQVADPEMLKTFNLGVGLTVVVDPAFADECCRAMAAAGADCYPIGRITAGGTQKVDFAGALNWRSNPSPFPRERAG